MFQFPGFALQLLGVFGLQPKGLPHSDICGSIPIGGSPQLFAAYHVLLRLREPRHSPCALTYFCNDARSRWILIGTCFFTLLFFSMSMNFFATFLCLKTSQNGSSLTISRRLQ